VEELHFAGRGDITVVAIVGAGGKEGVMKNEI